MKTPPTMLVTTTILCAGVFVGLAGCRGATDRDRMVRRNPTPELRTLYQRPVDTKNAMTVSFDENLRMFTQDLGRAFYTDRPSRLTREPVPQP